jgi:hypothetical protein
MIIGFSKGRFCALNFFPFGCNILNGGSFPACASISICDKKNRLTIIKIK